MKYFVNENCIGCGLCVSTCPEVFAFTDSGFARAEEKDVSDKVLKTAEMAREGCPVEAIEKA